MSQITAHAVKGNFLRTQNANKRAHFELLNPGKAGRSSPKRTQIVAKITHPKLKGYTTLRDQVQRIKHERNEESRRLRKK